MNRERVQTNGSISRSETHVMKLIRCAAVLLLASACSREPAKDQGSKTQPQPEAVARPAVPEQTPAADQTPPKPPAPPRAPKASAPDERPVGTTAATVVDGKVVNTDAMVMADFK